MLQTTYTDARANLASLCDDVTDNQEIVIIRRRKGKSVAMIDAAELQSLVETAHLMRSPKNAERLLSALDARSRARAKVPTVPNSGPRWALRNKDRLAVFQPEFREDLQHWVQTDRRVALRVLELVEAVMREPFTGIGKPEPLKYLSPAAWSRRLTQEHRVVCLVRDGRVDFLQVRFCY